MQVRFKLGPKQDSQKPPRGRAREIGQPYTCNTHIHKHSDSRFYSITLYTHTNNKLGCLATYGFVRVDLVDLEAEPDAEEIQGWQK